MRITRLLVFITAFTVTACASLPPTQVIYPKVLKVEVRPVDALGLLTLDIGGAQIPCQQDGTRLACNIPSAARAGDGMTLLITREGYNSESRRIPVPDKPIEDFAEIVTLTERGPAHVDPSKFSLNELAAIRGAMWTARWDGPLGPRPNQPDNILATDFLQCYGHDDQEKMLAIYTSKGYTHAVTGPIVDSDGYHGQYCVNDWRNHFEDYLDLLQMFYDHGLIPVIFIHPDNWSIEATQALTPFFQSERAQRLMRVIVPAGWEPTRYDWSSQTWALYGQWARETWPNALILIHTVVDVDAPVGTDDRGDDNGHPNGEGWARVAPYYHGWLTQLGACLARTDPTQEFKDIFNPNIRGSYTDRFQHGYAGWPTTSAWGNAPLRVYNGENCSYPAYWANYPEKDAAAWGDAAMAAGADGYLDGGTVPVPVK